MRATTEISAKDVRVEISYTLRPRPMYPWKFKGTHLRTRLVFPVTPTSERCKTATTPSQSLRQQIETGSLSWSKWIASRARVLQDWEDITCSFIPTLSELELWILGLVPYLRRRAEYLSRRELFVCRPRKFCGPRNDSHVSAIRSSEELAMRF